MTNSRQQNPRYNLTAVAHQLALYLSVVDPNELLQLMEEVKKNYGAPRESWLYGPFCWLFSIRDRLPAINQTMRQIEAESGEEKPFDPKPIFDLTGSGGWEETSFNTNFMRTLVRQLPDFNSEHFLPKENAFDLYKLLIDACRERADNEKELNEHQEKLTKIKIQQYVKQQELLELQKKENEKDEELKELEEQKCEKENEIKTLEDQILKKQAEMDVIKRKLLVVDIDMSGLSDVERAEASKLAEIAIRTYIAERAQQTKKQAELSSLHSTASAAKARLAQAAAQKVVKREDISVIQKSIMDARGEMGMRSDKLEQYKSSLSLLLSVRLQSEQPKSRLASLLQDGAHVKIQTAMPQNIKIVEDYVTRQPSASFKAARSALEKVNLFAKHQKKAPEITAPEKKASTIAAKAKLLGALLSGQQPCDDHETDAAQASAFDEEAKRLGSIEVQTEYDVEVERLMRL